MLNSSHYGILLHGFFSPSSICLLPNDYMHSIIQCVLFLVTLSLPSPICIATWWCSFGSCCNLMVSFPSLVLRGAPCLHAIIQWHSSILLFMFFSCLGGISFFILFFNGILWFPLPCLSTTWWYYMPLCLLFMLFNGAFPSFSCASTCGVVCDVVAHCVLYIHLCLRGATIWLFVFSSLMLYF
jgi:hypothetical protein